MSGHAHIADFLARNPGITMGTLIDRVDTLARDRDELREALREVLVLAEQFDLSIIELGQVENARALLARLQDRAPGTPGEGGR